MRAAVAVGLKTIVKYAYAEVRVGFSLKTISFGISEWCELGLW